jgi:hypothetical protein
VSGPRVSRGVTGRIDRMALREPARDPRRYGRAFVPWFALWAALGTGAGAGTGLAGPDDAAPPQASRTEAVRLDGSVLAGSLESVAPDGIRWSEGASATTLAPETLREVRFEPVRVRPALRVPHLRLTLVTGDRILGTFAAPGRDGIQIEHATAGALAIPFEVVRSIETLPAGGDPCLDAAATHPASTEGDRVYVRSGDAYAGVVVEAATEGIRIETERGAERTIPWNALTVVHLQVEPPSRGTPQALFAEIETDDGSRFAGSGSPTTRPAPATMR